jgi:hypothetical protein
MVWMQIHKFFKYKCIRKSTCLAYTPSTHLFLGEGEAARNGLMEIGGDERTMGHFSGLIFCCSYIYV